MWVGTAMECISVVMQLWVIVGEGFLLMAKPEPPDRFFDSFKEIVAYYYMPFYNTCHFNVVKYYNWIYYTIFKVAHP